MLGVGAREWRELGGLVLVIGSVAVVVGIAVAAGIAVARSLVDIRLVARTRSPAGQLVREGLAVQAVDHNRRCALVEEQRWMDHGGSGVVLRRGSSLFPCLLDHFVRRARDSH